MKRALITGITGQDGSYLAELLLKKKYEVFGVVRRLSTPNTWRIEKILDKIDIIEGDITDQTSLNSAIKESKPDEVYNLAAQSFVATSWKQPILTAEVTGVGVIRMLEAVKNHAPNARFYQASTSELYGIPDEVPQNEKTRFYPRSPYAFSKLLGFWATVNYRESFGMHTSNGILFNHESPRRGLEFVTRKITHTIAKIHLGIERELILGNLDAKRDWGYAPEYVEAMWMMLQQEKPDDFVIATGETHTVRDFVEKAFNAVGISDWKKYVKTDKKFMRPAEAINHCGDASKAKKTLGWRPKTKFEDLVKIMVEADLKRLEK